jgi:hypothetical protein
MEELNITGHEMVWTIRYFLHQQEQWRVRQETQTVGRAAFAATQAHRWNEMANYSHKSFLAVHPGLHTVFGYQSPPCSIESWGGAALGH